MYISTSPVGIPLRKRNVKIFASELSARRACCKRERQRSFLPCPSIGTSHNPDSSHSLPSPPRQIIIRTMEVASPLPFGHSATGNKRQFPGSPGLVDSTNRSPFTMHIESDEYANPRSFKRRRFTADDTMTDSDSTTVQASFPSFPSSAVQQKNSFSGASGESIVIVTLGSTAFFADIL